ncbi:hypothetical protein V5O48_000976 [Marasmius crinis-equi]|uniref:Uncharacterized protein n=1 Tax=Marasmius crinis-equi TaxID=585013 RepID=A0ABR3G097_9AGAR
MNDDRKRSNSLIITVIASAISSVGFGVSLVAIGVLWLFPSALGEPRSSNADDPQRITRPKNKDSRRKSAPPVLTISRMKRRVSTSPKPSSVIVVPVIVSPSSEASPSSGSRRVYFLEPQTKPKSSRRYSAPAVEPLSFEPRTSILQIPEDASPRSSSSTLVQVPPTSHHTVILDTCEEIVESADSDSSSKHSTRQSHFLSSAIPSRLKGRWAKRPSSSGSDTSSYVPKDSRKLSPSTPIKETRRSSFVINPPWSAITRSRTSVDLLDSPVMTQTSPIEPLQKAPTTPETLFFRNQKASGSEKTGRRTSMPRTQPYAYPYFAEPPTVPTEKNFVGRPEPLSQEERGRQEKRGRNAQAQASLGLGPRPPQRRAMSAVA